MWIEVWKKGTSAQPWHWHFKSRNGKIVADAEAFTTKAAAVKAGTNCVKTIIGVKQLSHAIVEQSKEHFRIDWPKVGG